jgi:S-DNA-T family DNA segregation ATPase FtsK/SpoIIIE
MPHLLVAGSTGSGKSVGLNAMLMSLLCRLSPDELKLILVDPKRLEFSSYADVGHLLFPIVVDPKKAIGILRWVVREMESRYEKMANVGVRNIVDYNVRAKEVGFDNLPYMVVVIDELADLMMTAGKDIEEVIARIAQMARASGIHMILATQRPSVDVITGLIKVNFPSRISFRVTSRVDSRTILDVSGAEKLLGRGDMLFLDSTKANLRRIHGAYVSDKEIRDVVEYVKSLRDPEYLELETSFEKEYCSLEKPDELLDEIITFLENIEGVSISLLQRKFRIGYNRSARIIDELEHQGLIMPPDGSKLRKIIR